MSGKTDSKLVEEASSDSCDQSLRNLAAVAFKDDIIVFGGSGVTASFSEEGEFISDVSCYADIQSIKWTLADL